MIWFSGGKGRRRAPLRAAVSVVGAAAVLALALPAAAQAANTWSGTWINSAPDSTSWAFTQSGSGQTVDGVWKGSASSGTLSGTISGSTLNGTLVNNEQNQSASFSITLAPDGHSFSGTFGSTGQWRSACYGGPCLSNAAPVLPPVLPPGGGAPAPQTSPKLLAAAAAWGQAGPAAVLGPGEQAIVPSPKISAKQRELEIAVNDGTVAANLVLNIGVGAAPEHKPKPDPLVKRGDCVRAAAGRALRLKSFVGHKQDERDLAVVTEEDVLQGFVDYMILCLDLVKRLEAQAGTAALGTATVSAQPSCKVRAYPLSGRVDHAKGRIDYRTGRASKRAPSRLLRTSCKRAKDGKLTLRIRTRSRRTKLRKVLGPRLVLGIHRPAAASGTANVQTTFKR